MNFRNSLILWNRISSIYNFDIIKTLIKISGFHCISIIVLFFHHIFSCLRFQNCFCYGQRFLCLCSDYLHCLFQKYSRVFWKNSSKMQNWSGSDDLSLWFLVSFIWPFIKRLIMVGLCSSLFLAMHHCSKVRRSCDDHLGRTPNINDIILVGWEVCLWGLFV